MSVREHWINVRVNPEELARIREKQKEFGIRNTGAYIRKMAVSYTHLDVYKRQSEEFTSEWEVETYRQQLIKKVQEREAKDWLYVEQRVFITFSRYRLMSSRTSSTLA